MNLEKQLLEGLNKLEAGLPKEREWTSTHLLQYIHFLDKWNRVHNLTAVREPEEMVTKHVLDSLTLLPVISGTHHADVGSWRRPSRYPVGDCAIRLACNLD